MPLPVLLPAGGLLAKVATSCSKMLPYALKWAPYYVVKFGLIYGIKKYPGGTPGLYRTSLRVVRRRFPPCDQQHRARAVALVREAFRVPGRAEAAVQGLDFAIGEIIREDAKTRRDEGIPEEFVECVWCGLPALLPSIDLPPPPRCCCTWVLASLIVQRLPRRRRFLQRLQEKQAILRRMQEMEQQERAAATAASAAAVAACGGAESAATATANAAAVGGVVPRCHAHRVRPADSSEC
jgi:hypothetical protein